MHKNASSAKSQVGGLYESDNLQIIIFKMFIYIYRVRCKIDQLSTNTFKYRASVYIFAQQ